MQLCGHEKCCAFSFTNQYHNQEAINILALVEPDTRDMQPDISELLPAMFTSKAKHLLS